MAASDAKPCKIEIQVDKTKESFNLWQWEDPIQEITGLVPEKAKIYFNQDRVKAIYNKVQQERMKNKGDAQIYFNLLLPQKGAKNEYKLMLFLCVFDEINAQKPILVLVREEDMKDKMACIFTTALKPGAKPVGQRMPVWDENMTRITGYSSVEANYLGLENLQIPNLSKLLDHPEEFTRPKTEVKFVSRNYHPRHVLVTEALREDPKKLCIDPEKLPGIPLLVQDFKTFVCIDITEEMVVKRDRSHKIAKINDEINAFIAGFVLFGITGGGSEDPNEREKNMMVLEVVAFGCFVGAFVTNLMYIKIKMKDWEQSYPILFFVGKVLGGVAVNLLMAIVIIETKEQIGDKYPGAWIWSTIFLVPLITLPVLSDLILSLFTTAGFWEASLAETSNKGPRGLPPEREPLLDRVREGTNQECL